MGERRGGGKAERGCAVTVVVTGHWTVVLCGRAGGGTSDRSDDPYGYYYYYGTSVRYFFFPAATTLAGCWLLAADLLLDGCCFASFLAQPPFLPTCARKYLNKFQPYQATPPKKSQGPQKIKIKSPK